MAGGGGSGENVAVFWYLDGRALDWLGQTGPGRGVQGRNSIGKQKWFLLIIRKMHKK